MPNVTENKMAIEMASCGGLGILHRFMTVEENVNQYKMAQKGIRSVNLRDSESYIGVSIGVKDGERLRFDRLYEAGARIFCIDIAHGHCAMMKEMITWIRNYNYRDIVIIAGNIATKRAALNLVEWGADIIKVGIGPGSVCITRRNTGVGKPQFSALMEVHEVLKETGETSAKIISDGGIKTAGDVAKALIFADAVMVGAVLAGTIETPGEVYTVEGTDLTNRQYYKMYGGSASRENKVINGQASKFVEGEMRRIPFKGHAKYLLREIEEGLQSAFSYSGARDLKEYKAKVKWSMISSGGRTESKL
jgi:IMP dehydrogenase